MSPIAVSEPITGPPAAWIQRGSPLFALSA